MKQEIELYIHIPFCVKKCNYCDFLSFPSGTEQQEKYALQLIKELTFRSPLCGEYAVSSVFIGGGTPSIISEKLITEIMQTIDKYYYVKPDMEVTIECNPASAMRHKFTAYRNAGINRLSMGLQSADNAELKMLGRIHTFEDFLKSYQSARMEGFTNINIDLINCFPMPIHICPKPKARMEPGRPIRSQADISEACADMAVTHGPIERPPRK